MIPKFYEDKTILLFTLLHINDISFIIFDTEILNFN